jgi:hypothetical protein
MRFTTETRFARYERDYLCHTGIEEILIGTTLAETLGGGVFGSLAAGGLEGAALGAGSSLLTGGDPLKGALSGGITGGFIGGAGPAIGAATGLGTTAGDVIAGGLGGAAGGLITGGSPLTGALTGAGGGLVAGLGGGSGGGSAPSATVSNVPASGISGGTSAAAAAPATITPPAGGAPVDLTGGTGSALSASLGISAPPPPSVSGVGGTVDANGNPFAASSSKSGFDIGSFISKNPGVLLGGGLLGAQMLMGNEALPAEKQLNQAAGEARSLGRAFTAPIFSGTLPPGAQAAVDSATNAAKAKVKSSYASLGLAGSTMEAQNLAAVDREAAAQTFKMADMLLAQGADYTKLSDSLYQTLLQTQLAQESDFSKSLGVFASGLAGAKFNTSG